MKIKTILTIFFLFILYMYVANVTLIPENIIVLRNENLKFNSMPGISFKETMKTFSLDNETKMDSSLEINLFENINLRNVNLTTLEEIEIVPVGKIVGLKLYTNGVLVVGMTEIEDESNNLVKPYEKTDIKEGDMIIEINGEEIDDIQDLKNTVNKTSGKQSEIKLLREGKSIVVSNIKPVKSFNNEYKLGLWVKDAATGVGTMTYYEPETKKFALLGHGITDADTNSLIYIDSGELVTSKVVSVKKGESGNPGEIRGTILKQKTIGNVDKNSSFGVFGVLNDLTSLNIDTSKRYKIALRNEIQEGKAKILCSTDDTNKVDEYEIEIEKIYKENDSNNKSMLLRITDEKLIEKTGGIIRGLSGAPIIQNNKFIGAITNVLVSNPEIGYGIFADLMIKEMNK
ncbi:MAG: SpoIVB peptidase [Clostridia bacterium]|nr:SpoIVB peptidase [Clostridia bacterium]